MRVRMAYGVTRPFLIAAAAAAVGLLNGACALDSQDSPELVGPSEQGVSVQLRALSDTVNADGVSNVGVQLNLRDNSGGPVNGQAVYFELESGDGTLVPQTGATYVGPVQGGFVMATDSNGLTRVVYVAGTSVGAVARISVRPYGIDGVRDFYRSVDILQK